jgi:hypothetical protein
MPMRHEMMNSAPTSWTRLGQNFECETNRLRHRGMIRLSLRHRDLRHPSSRCCGSHWPFSQRRGSHRLCSHDRQ